MILVKVFNVPYSWMLGASDGPLLPDEDDGAKFATAVRAAIMQFDFLRLQGQKDVIVTFCGVPAPIDDNHEALFLEICGPIFSTLRQDWCAKVAHQVVVATRGLMPGYWINVFVDSGQTLGR